jgi:hypothetical protein
MSEMNWAGNHAYKPRDPCSPHRCRGSTARRRFRSNPWSGTRHSFNDVADGEGDSSLLA